MLYARGQTMLFGKEITGRQSCSHRMGRMLLSHRARADGVPWQP